MRYYGEYMYLKKLEMSGFKSFATKTVLNFSSDKTAKEHGITAIVGPNGSGKSNVADAIRWALGEQSSKNLRGKKSEDVIFAGSGSKSRLGGASVTLYFDNVDKRIPLEYTEVTITRRLFRSGESEYLVNGSRVRLSDITDILAQSGIGKDSYCVITQGMSDAVLNATPVERRGIFEDAAGVKHCQLRKDRSLRKMESTRENLLRVNGLIMELEPHVKNLARLAEKASKRKDYADDLRMKQEKLLGFLWYRFEDDRTKTARERDTLVLALEEGSAEMSRLEKCLNEASAKFRETKTTVEAEQSIRKSRERSHYAEREMALLSGRIQAEEERRIPREEVRSIPVDLAFVRERLAEFRKDQETLIARLGTVEKLSELQDLKELARVIQTRMFELHENVGKGSVMTKRLVTLSDEDMLLSDKKLMEWRKQSHTLKQECINLAREVNEKEAFIRSEKEKQEVSRQTFFETEKQFRERQNEYSAAKDALNDAKIRMARVEVREEDLTNRIAAELSIAPTQLQRVTGMLDEQSIERDIARLKVQLEHIGGIDPLIVDEYKETQQRYDFLTRESSDLNKALEALQSIVRDMNEKIRKEFETAFQSIHKEFEHYFTLIFGGGKATLSRITIPMKNSRGNSESDEDAMETDDALSETIASQMGIEITACPPGKKIANLSMLSGGERSLTSLALLFAIIAHNPPPFVVLDEVEAALDEENSRRLSRVLRELSDKTQFVAITHNRETMRQASFLYGVTMGDDGVSKLLSLRLDQKEQVLSARDEID